jgi:hypothetical protein
MGKSASDEASEGATGRLHRVCTRQVETSTTLVNNKLGRRAR